MGRITQNGMTELTTCNHGRKKIVVARVIELATLVAMNTHVYSFCGQLYVHSKGWPIGMRSTASDLTKGGFRGRRQGGLSFAGPNEKGT